MPYYPNIRFAFATLFDLVPSIPQVHLSAPPLQDRQITDLGFYNYLLTVNYWDWTWINGDLYSGSWFGDNAFGEAYAFYYEP